MKLITEISNQRFYELDFIINNGINGGIQPTNIVCISDAHTHVERLVFPVYLEDGFTAEDIELEVPRCIRIDYSEIEGTMTMMIDGGREDSVEDDCEYIKRLRKYNL